MGRKLLIAMMAAALGGLTIGCDDDGNDNTPDAGPGDDGGMQCPPPPPELPQGTRPDVSAVECPSDDRTTPAPEEQMGTCCWRHSNADQLDSPELRLTYINIVAPVGATLTQLPVWTVLNRALQEQSFNWLVRVEGADGDGPITITTGFGRRTSDGTYAFSSGEAEGDPASWCPVSIDGTITGETVSSERYDGSLTVPIFDEEGENVQLELILRNIEITEATLGEDRSCIGWKTSRNYAYHPEGLLRGFIEVDAAKTGMIDVPGLTTTICTALAGTALGELDYCDTVPQSEWNTKPDSLCDETGCRQNTPCETDVCDPDTTCNAWALVAHFAASGVDITNSTCGS